MFWVHNGTGQCVTRDDVMWQDCSIVEHQPQRKLGLRQLGTATDGHRAGQWVMISDVVSVVWTACQTNGAVTFLNVFLFLSTFFILKNVHWKFHQELRAALLKPQKLINRPRFYYRAMHFSAKRGIAIACRLSVCLSVTLVNCDHIGWNSSKIMSPLVSLGCSLFATPNMTGLLQGEHP